MTNFEEKIHSVLARLEAEGKIVIKDDHIFPTDDWVKKEKPEQELIDPMVMEDNKEAFETKRKMWDDIFMQHPGFADMILDLVIVYGGEVYDKLTVMYKDGKVALGWVDPKEDKED